MHVLHVGSGRHRYGGAAQVLMLAAGLPALGCRSSFACAADSGGCPVVLTRRATFMRWPRPSAI